MSLPDMALDDLRFQRLVYECRDRVHELCPDWTEANVSDPGITLIELFAWMTDQLSYRINRVPEKLHVALLSLLDVCLYPPSVATTELCFWLVDQPPDKPREAVVISARTTEVSTARTSGQDPVVFQTVKDFTIEPIALDTCLLCKAGEDPIEVQVRGGVALPSGEKELHPFSSPPQTDDALLLGFDASLDQLVIRLEVECVRAQGVGVKPKAPPLTWEAYTGEIANPWAPVQKLKDTTAGFNEAGEGAIELEMPARLAEHLIPPFPHRRQWLRCRVTPGDGTDVYKVPPLIHKLSARPIGARLPAEHSQRIQDELLGRSDGTPGQVLRLQRAPILALRGDEGLEVCESGKVRVRWTQVGTFAQSGPDDRHYMLDASAGEIELGPAVRQHDGSFRLYGATPPAGAELRFVAYRYGGGTVGNVKAGSLTHLRHPVPGVGAVSQPEPAKGGSDGETLENASARTAIELRTGGRAITARDYERLCHDAAPDRVGRARCLPGERGEDVRVLIVPRIGDAGRKLEPPELDPLDPGLVDTLKSFLDECRLVGVRVRLGTPKYVVVTAVVRVVAELFMDASALKARIEQRLYAYLNPLVGGPSGSGWDFERALGPGELYPVVQGIDGVQHISVLRVYTNDPATGREQVKPLQAPLSLGPDELFLSGTHRVMVEAPPR